MRKHILVLLMFSALVPAISKAENGQQSAGGLPNLIAIVKAQFDTVVSELGRLEDLIKANADAISKIGKGAPTFDYRDYLGSNLTSKTFDVSGAQCGDIETQTFVRTPQPDGSVHVAETRSRLNGGTLCQLDVLNYIATASDYRFASRDQMDIFTPNVVVNRNEFNQPIILRTNAMREGGGFGSGSVTRQINVIGGGAMTEGYATNVSILLGTEDVTVPAGTYAGCLRIAEQRNSTHFGQFDNVSWYCPGVGLTKRVQQNIVGSAGLVMRLAAVTTQ